MKYVFICCSSVFKIHLLTSLLKKKINKKNRFEIFLILLLKNKFGVLEISPERLNRFEKLKPYLKAHNPGLNI